MTNCFKTAIYSWFLATKAHLKMGVENLSIYIYIYNCQATSTDYSDCLSLFVSIIHRFNIQCLYRAVVDWFKLFVQHLHVRVKGSIGEPSLMSSFLFLQQCPACLVRLSWMLLEMGGRWPYSCFCWVLLPGFVQYDS